MIRLARATEADLVCDIVHTAYRPYVARIGKEPGPMLDDYPRRIADNQAWVLEYSDRVVGVLVLEERGDVCMLDNVAVLPEAQGWGYGRALVAFAEAEAQRRGYGVIHLYTHALMIENQALYRRLGFTETRRVTEQGFDRVYMRKALA